MKKNCRAKVMVEVFARLLAGATILTMTLAHSPALAELSIYDPQGLRATTLEEVLALPDEEIDLATAILILSGQLDISFSVRETLEEINKMALEARILINTEDDPVRVVGLINHYLFERKSYAYVDYSSHSGLEVVEQKSLPQVIKNRKGGCVGLSLLYLTLTERLGLPFHGVALPDHFFVRYDNGEKKINIETTRKGKEWNDRAYEKEYELPPTNRKRSFYLRSLSKKEVIGVFLYNLGTAYCNEGMYDETIVRLITALEINPSFAEAHYNLGIAYGRKGMYDEEIAEYKKVIEINPSFAEAHSGLGLAYGKKGMYDEAIAEYKKAIELNPNDAEAHGNLGIAYGKKGMYDEEIAEYKKVIEINPSYAEAHYNLGIAYGKKGMYDEAIAEFKKAIEINPSDADAHYNLAVTYYFKGEYDLAIKHCDKSIELGYQVHPEFLEALKPYR